jgi:hypothetical protein
MNQRALERYAPLTGVVFVVLLVIAVVVGGETPDNKDSAQKMVDFWKDNEGAQFASTLIGAWSAVFFLWFSASLRNALRRNEAVPHRLSSLAFAGAVIATTGLLMTLSLSFAAVDTVGDVPAQVTQTLTVLSNEVFFPIAVGLGVFYLATGILAVRSRALPAWLGWVAIVIGIACITPVGFFAILVGLLWVLVVSVILYRSEEGPVEGRARRRGGRGGRRGPPTGRARREEGTP